jgi:hypothetical protein
MSKPGFSARLCLFYPIAQSAISPAAEKFFYCKQAYDKVILPLCFYKTRVSPGCNHYCSKGFCRLTGKSCDYLLYPGKIQRNRYLPQ